MINDIDTFRKTDVVENLVKYSIFRIAFKKEIAREKKSRIFNS